MAKNTQTTTTTQAPAVAPPQAATSNAAASNTAAPPPSTGLLQRLLTEGKLVRDESQVPIARDLIGEFVNQILEPSMTVNPDTITMLNHRIAQLDELISNQLNQVLHAEPFQKLEAAWRGLHYLVMNTETGPHLKLRVMNATKKELLDDLERATEFDQSALFKKVYEEEYGTFGGEPYGLLVGDYDFGRHPRDVALLEKISHVAAAAHAPFISTASPTLFDLDSFMELETPRDLAKLFESSELIKWRSFRETEDSRYVALALPRVLLRLPYGPDTLPVDGFNFVEDVDGTDHRKYLWGNAAWALAQRITHAFALHRWCANIRGVENGGVVTGLPTHTFRTDEGELALKCPTEIAITDRREKELSDLGFLPLCHCKGTDYAAFFGSQTVNKPKTYDTHQANANASLSAQLPYILTASRFAHYLKVIMRDKLGSFTNQVAISSYLNRWISNYVLLNESGGPEMKAANPLNEARIDVVETPGKVGAYRAVAFLKPHFQLSELTASIRLVAELPAPAQA